MGLIKIITTLFPFLIEVFLGGQTLREAISHNKRGLTMLLMFTALLIVLYLIGTKLIKMSGEHTKLQADNAALVKENKALKAIKLTSSSTDMDTDLVCPDSPEGMIMIPDELPDNSDNNFALINYMFVKEQLLKMEQAKKIKGGEQ